MYKVQMLLIGNNSDGTLSLMKEIMNIARIFDKWLELEIEYLLL